MLMGFQTYWFICGNAVCVVKLNVERELVQEDLTLVICKSWRSLAGIVIPYTNKD